MCVSGWAEGDPLILDSCREACFNEWVFPFPLLDQGCCLAGTQDEGQGGDPGLARGISGSNLPTWVELAV